VGPSRFAALPAVVLAACALAGQARGASWSEPIHVAHLDRPALVRGAAIAGDEAVVAWEDYDVIGAYKATNVTNFAVWASAAPVGPGFGAPRLLGSARDDPGPSLASSATGWSAVAWDADGAVEVAVRAPHGVFSQPIAVPGAQAVGGAKVGIDDAGTATVVWSEFGTSLPFTSPIRSVTVLPDGAVSVPRTLGADGSAGGAVFVAVGGRGDAAVAWTGYVAGAAGSRARAALRPREGDFGTPATFADPGAYLYASGAVVDDRGNATVAIQRWRQDAPAALAGPGVLVVEGATTGGWGMPQALNGSGGVVNLELVANAPGDRAALWDVNQWDARQPSSSRVALAAAAQPFGALVTPAAWLTGGALTGDGETLVLSGDPTRGLEVHPFTATGTAGPTEPLLRDACAGTGGVIAAGAASGLAAVAYQSDQHELRVVYRGAGPPPRARRPRICSLTVTVGEPRTVTMRLSAPVAHITVGVRRLAPHARVVSRRRLGARDRGDVRVTLRTLSPGRYRASARAVDAAGRRSAVATADFRVTRRHRR
jgi:hypothetical protein